MKRLNDRKKDVEKDIVRMYKECSVYNFYIKANGLKVEQVNSVVEEVITHAMANATEGNSGQPRV